MLVLAAGHVTLRQGAARRFSAGQQFGPSGRLGSEARSPGAPVAMADERRRPPLRDLASCAWAAPALADILPAVLAHCGLRSLLTLRLVCSSWNDALAVQASLLAGLLERAVDANEMGARAAGAILEAAPVVGVRHVAWLLFAQPTPVFSRPVALHRVDRASPYGPGEEPSPRKRTRELCEAPPLALRWVALGELAAHTGIELSVLLPASERIRALESIGRVYQRQVQRMPQAHAPGLRCVGSSALVADEGERRESIQAQVHDTPSIQMHAQWRLMYTESWPLALDRAVGRLINRLHDAPEERRRRACRAIDELQHAMTLYVLRVIRSGPVWNSGSRCSRLDHADAAACTSVHALRRALLAEDVAGSAA